jgi:hypothetical protein
MKFSLETTSSHQKTHVPTFLTWIIFLHENYHIYYQFQNFGRQIRLQGFEEQLEGLHVCTRRVIGFGKPNRVPTPHFASKPPFSYYPFSRSKLLFNPGDTCSVLLNDIIPRHPRATRSVIAVSIMYL